MAKKHRRGYLYRRGSVWWVQYIVDGKKIRESLGTESRAEAERLQAEKLRPLMAAEKADALAAIVAKLAVAKTEATKLADEAAPPLTLSQAWPAYVDAQNRPDSGDRTMVQYETELRRFSTWAGEVHPGALYLRDVSADMAETYARHLVAAKVSPSTFNQHVGFLRLLWKVLADKARVLTNPWSGIKRKVTTSVGRRELTVDELKKVCRAAEGELRLLLALGLYLGARLGDAACMKWESLDLHRGFARYTPHKTARRSGKPKVLTVPLHPGLLALLSEILPDKRQGYVMPGLAKNYTERGAYAVCTLVLRHFQSCGLETTQRGGGCRNVGKASFHSLRHSAVSLLREAGAPLSVTMAIVGHSSLAVHDGYTHTGELAMKAAVAALPSILSDAPAAKALPAPRTVDADKIRALAGRLTAKNGLTIKQELLALCG